MNGKPCPEVFLTALLMAEKDCKRLRRTASGWELFKGGGTGGS
jgi:hypothetical protein